MARFRERFVAMQKENYKSQITKLASGAGFRTEISTDTDKFADSCAVCRMLCSSSCRYSCRKDAEKCPDAEIVADAEPRAERFAIIRAEVFAERRAEIRADVRAENRLNRSFCPIDVTYCINLVHIRLDKVQNCANAEKFAVTVQPQRGDLFIDGAAHIVPVAPLERPVKK
jgi:hypothetical protein